MFGGASDRVPTVRTPGLPSPALPYSRTQRFDVGSRVVVVCRRLPSRSGLRAASSRCPTRAVRIGFGPLPRVPPASDRTPSGLSRPVRAASRRASRAGRRTSSSRPPYRPGADLASSERFRERMPAAGGRDQRDRQSRARRILCAESVRPAWSGPSGWSGRRMLRVRLRGHAGGSRPSRFVARQHPAAPVW